jgi:hypothetical protein
MDPNMTIKVPDAVREMGAKAVEQTEKAFDTFLSAANQSVAAIPSPAADISKKTLAFTEQNIRRPSSMPVNSFKRRTCKKLCKSKQTFSRVRFQLPKSK